MRTEYLSGQKEAQPRTDRGRPPLTGPDSSLDQPKAATQLSTGWIETYSGLQWNCVDPRPEDVRLTDVAHGLALMCRFGGQVRVPYSVGQHSLYVYREIQKDFPQDYLLQLHALLHDASEAYLSDLVRPLKRQLPEYTLIEAKTQIACEKGLGLHPLTNVGPGHVDIKRADNAVLMAERRDLFQNSKWEWSLDEEPIVEPIIPTSNWKFVEQQLIATYYYLRGRFYIEQLGACCVESTCTSDLGDSTCALV